MDTKKFILGMTTAIGMSIMGTGLILKDDGSTQRVSVVEVMHAVEGEASAALAKQLADSGAPVDVVCEVGVLANRPPETVYCHGGTAGFELSAKAAGDLVDELEAKQPGVVAAKIELTTDRGKLYARYVGVTE